MEDADALSIGAVLSVLQEEFPDVTISKIRFLESQGLVRPDRNTSGYRQFFDTDVERLRWILRQQRDHFLPLKVIKKALDRGVDIHDAGDGDQPTLWSSVADAAAADEATAEHDRKLAEERRQTRGGHPADGTAGRPAGRPRHSTPADVVAALQEDPRTASPGPGGEKSPTDPSRGGDDTAEKAPPPATTSPPAKPRKRREAMSMRATTMTRDELVAAVGIEEDLLLGLEEFGLVEPGRDAGEPVYDESALEVARAAVRLSQLGVGPRHLRIYKVAAEREAGFIEQLVMPLLKQRNPDARTRAGESASELQQLGGVIHSAILARELGPDLRG